ncbi:BON domain-containing protein [Phenylobacterium immobile]|uniref:BON domain-containing protein n=1 Tax=Phenylobacterium immobile TaxID=21 RepID=UPI000AC2B54A|nr:BON domain-containing protein [Phenylobacterium immobile]
MAQDLKDFHGRSLANGPLDRKPSTLAEDFGQADYSTEYGYDPHTRTGYRLEDDGSANRKTFEAPASNYALKPDPEVEERTFTERGKKRVGPSDRVLWAVIVERLEDERRLDLSDVQVLVQDGEVTLNGTVKHKADKRHIEEIADIDGISNVQNNLRTREKKGLF